MERPRNIRSSQEIKECAVCLEEIDRAKSCVNLSCTHAFHKACIGQWLEQKESCPLCRKNVKVEFVELLRKRERSTN